MWLIAFCFSYFPFLFNTPENEAYVGTLPDLEFYCPGTLKPEARVKLEEWHATEKVRVGDGFNMMAEMRAYCESDVDILLNCCMKYRDIMLKRASVDVFVESVTIAR